ncbi:MAG: hypothetical protein K2H31_03930 [Lachnospiraceae bacterium]|nr:hypothetical protein [Lachnospiraceae bacterium]
MYGHNEIILKFISPGLSVGSILTLLGTAGLAAGVLFERIRRKRSSISCDIVRENSSLSKMTVKTMAWIYRILFVGGLAMVYIIPAVGLTVYIIMKVIRLGS